MGSTLDELKKLWRDSTTLNTAQVAIADQLRMMANMDRAQRRAEAQADCYLTGEYNPPDEGDDMTAIYFNNLMVGDEAIEAIKDEAQQPSQPSQPPQSTNTRRKPSILWPILAALALLIGALAIAWAMYNRPPTAVPISQAYEWRFED